MTRGLCQACSQNKITVARIKKTCFNVSKEGQVIQKKCHVSSCPNKIRAIKEGVCERFYDISLAFFSLNFSTTWL